MKNWLRRFVVGTVFGVAGVSLAHANEVGVTSDTIKVGVLGSLTGPAAIWGTGNLAGATLAFEQVNAEGGVHGRKIQLVSMDDETSAPKGMAAFSRLVDSEEVFAVVGPTSSAVGVPLLGQLKESGVPVFISIFSSPAMTEPSVRNIFRAGIINERMQGRAIAKYLVERQGHERIAVLRQSDEYGENGGRSVTEKLNEMNVKPVAVEVFNAADTDFTAQVLRLRSAKPDAIVIYGYPAASAILTRQIRELGIKAKIIGSNAATNQNYPAMVGPAAAGVELASTLVQLPEGDAEPMASFSKAFKTRFPDLARQERPGLSDILGYGGALNFIEGLRRAGPELSREGFIKALESFDGYASGVTVPTYFSDTRREGNDKVYILRIQDDLSRTIDPNAIEAD